MEDVMERRFGGLTRLYGPDVLARLAQQHVAIVGIGGVGSWAAEALARSGIGKLTLIDLDHVAESNINRQAHADTETLGMAKIDAMAARIRRIHPQCELRLIDDFLSADNLDDCLSTCTAVLDCADQVSAKLALIVWARQHRCPLVVCGGAGGKTDPLTLRAGDLSETTHDALLAKIRNQLRKHHGFPKAADAAGKPRGRIPKMKVRVLWLDQAARLPEQWQSGQSPQGLSCAGYGSVVTVTAAMGLAAANEVLMAL